LVANSNQYLKTKNGLIPNSTRAVTLSEVWHSQEPSFMRMKIDKSIVYVKQVLLEEIGKMVAILKADMQDIQIKYMIDYILKHYYSYTVSDITCITDRLVKNNPYGKPILQNLIHELDQYSIEKQEFAVEYRVKEKNEIKDYDDEITKSIKKTYISLRNKKEEISQKEKDADAIVRNNEKIEQMKREGLI